MKIKKPSYFIVGDGAFFLIEESKAGEPLFTTCPRIAEKFIFHQEAQKRARFRQLKIYRVVPNYELELL